MSIIKKLREQGKKQTSGRKFRREREEDNAANWATVDAMAVLQCIAQVSAGGGAVRFGYTVDGGAYALGIYGDGAQPYTEYVRPSEDIERILAELGAVFDGDSPDNEGTERTATKNLSPTATQKGGGHK